VADWSAWDQRQYEAVVRCMGNLVALLASSPHYVRRQLVQDVGLGGLQDLIRPLAAASIIVAFPLSLYPTK
jgi:hypothetical protein